MKTKTSLFIGLLFISVNFLTAQIGKKAIPDDLNTSKIVFLKLDSAEESKDKPKDKAEKVQVANRKKYNKNVSKANDELMVSSKKYPFVCTTAHRDEINKYKALGYKYVLDFQPFVKLREGEIRADADNTESYPLYLSDLSNNSVYIVDYVDQYFSYEYSTIIEKIFLKEVKKKYKLK